MTFLIPFLQGNGECASFPVLAGNLQRAVMLLDHLAADGEPQADAVEKIIPAAVHVIEAVEDARLVLLGDANAEILHVCQYIASIQLGSYLHGGSRVTELDGIIYERHERA